jgi:hypothetical protein
LCPFILAQAFLHASSLFKVTVAHMVSECGSLTNDPTKGSVSPNAPLNQVTTLYVVVSGGRFRTDKVNPLTCILIWFGYCDD